MWAEKNIIAYQKDFASRRTPAVSDKLSHKILEVLITNQEEMSQMPKFKGRTPHQRLSIFFYPMLLQIKQTRSKWWKRNLDGLATSFWKWDMNILKVTDKVSINQRADRDIQGQSRLPKVQEAITWGTERVLAFMHSFLYHLLPELFTSCFQDITFPTNDWEEGKLQAWICEMYTPELAY